MKSREALYVNPFTSNIGLDKVCICVTKYIANSVKFLFLFCKFKCRCNLCNTLCNRDGVTGAVPLHVDFISVLAYFNKGNGPKAQLYRLGVSV